MITRETALSVLNRVLATCRDYRKLEPTLDNVLVLKLTVAHRKELAQHGLQTALLVESLNLVETDVMNELILAFHRQIAA